MRSTLFVFLLIFAVLPTACERRGDVSSGPDGEQAATTSGNLLAKVNGEVLLTVDDFHEAIASLPEYTQKRIDTKAERRKELERMIDDALLLREARRRGVDQDKEVLGKIDRYRKKVIAEKLYQQVTEDQPEIDEKDIRTYYEDHKDRFVQEERIRARQILVAVPKDATPEKIADAKAKAEKALQKARAKDNFAELAKQYSEGPNAARGGDIGYFTRGRMFPDFEKAAFGLENVGDISEVVETPLGYHIIQLTERIESRQQALSEVRDRITHQLEIQRRRDIRQSLPSKLREGLKIEVFDDHL